ncbi:DUF2599 domain-containing protein [Pseudomonas fluorescens]|uniref:DUF2599 domain-containing protein n=1 Tax=Pseudomonas fluorescens TaxID=294 RepID=UPI0020CA7245|nr:DUF2599 domain-containing protein [Pseudomonas fluorescens]
MKKYGFMGLWVKLWVMSIVAFSSGVHASAGSDAVTLMTYFYKHTARDCGPGRLASECSGLYLRGTDSGKTFVVWNVSPASKVSGGVSVSYFRIDSEYQDLGLLKNNGFVLKPNDFIAPGELKVKTLCMAPVDAWTDNRTDAGCADYKASAEVEKTCQEAGVKTPAAWLANYRSVGNDHRKQCIFDTVKDCGSFNKADAFNAAIEARKLIKDEEIKTQTEARLAVWPDNSNLPILAWIYTGIKGRPDADGKSFAGRTLAQDDQRRWSEDTQIRLGKGAFIPVIDMKMPASTADDATFTYLPGDQKVPPGDADKGSCDSYIEKAEWNNNYYEPVAKKTIPSLQVTPTACGRTIGPEKTDVAFAELALKAANHPSWNLDRMGTSMRRQFVCHVATPSIAAGKETWNLEPDRPYVSQAEAVAQGCNPQLK